MQGDTWECSKASPQVDSFGKEMLTEGPSFMYKYKGEVPIPFLGQVDDLLGVAEAGYKTKHLYSFVNVKTADKELQLGPEKCKTMTISKKTNYSCQDPVLEVDAWNLKHNPNGEMTDNFVGKVKMDEENSFVYLGHVLDKIGGILKNIFHKKNKYIGTQKLYKN